MELLEYRRIQGLSGGGHMLERGEVEAVEVLLDQESVDGRRGAEGGDVILPDQREQLGWHELVVVVHEHGRTHYPLSVELAPDGLSPAGVGVGEVDGIGRELMPVGGGDQMAEGVGVRVEYHLRLVGRAGSEVHQHGVLALVSPVSAFPGRCGGHSGLEILEAFGHGRAYADELFEERALGLGVGNFLKDIFVAAADDGLDLGGFATVDNVVGCQQEGGRNGHRSYFLEGQHGGPEGDAAFEDEHHEVAAADSQRGQVAGNLVGFALEVGKSKPALRLGGTCPQQGKFVRRLSSPGVHYIVCKIEMLGNIELQILPFAFEKSFNHSGLSLSGANIAKCWRSVRFEENFLLRRESRSASRSAGRADHRSGREGEMLLAGLLITFRNC